MLKLLEELLPFLVLIAITVGGKWLESKRRQAQPPPPMNPAPRPPVMESQSTPAPADEVEDDEPLEEEWEPVEVPRHPEPPVVPTATVPHPMSQMPPVANVPDPLRQLMQSIGMELPKPVVLPVEPEPLVAVPEVRQAEARQRVQSMEETVVPVSTKRGLDASPAAVRQAMMWKTILEEPRHRRPWMPMAR